MPVCSTQISCAELREMTRKADTEKKTQETAARNFERIERQVWPLAISGAKCSDGGTFICSQGCVLCAL